MVNKTNNFSSKGIFSTCRDVNNGLLWTFVIDKCSCFTTLFIT